MRSHFPLLLASLLLSCHQPRPHSPASAPSTPAPPPTPYPAPVLDAQGLDIGPADAWYSRNAGRIQLDSSASADDLSLAINLMAWVARGEEEAWRKVAPRIEAAYAHGPAPLKLPVLPVNAEESRKYHAAGSPHTQPAEGPRDPATEESYFKKALLLNLSDPDLWNHLAITASLRKDYRSAERFAKTAIAVDPSFLGAYQELAYAYKNSERYREAVEVADRGLKVDGDLHTKAVLLARQGQAWWMLGERDKALAAFSSSKRIGGPEWIHSYLEGRQELGKSFQPSPTPTPPTAP